MKLDARLSLLFSLGILGACASTPTPDKASPRERCYSHGEIRTCTDAPAPSRQQVDDVKRLRLPPAGVSRVVLVRNDWRDAYGHAQLVLDGVALPAMIPCSVVGMDVRPGEHLLHAGAAAGAESPLRLSLKSQEVTVVKVKRLPRGAASRGFGLQLVGHTEALALVQECAVLGFEDRTASSAEVR
ncbi:MAG: hypothetical protein HYX44_12470 [Aquabacterium sp.]|nr:hypothetical protein [Aquabacterium sp.]